MIFTIFRELDSNKPVLTDWTVKLCWWQYSTLTSTPIVQKLSRTAPAPGAVENSSSQGPLRETQWLYSDAAPSCSARLEFSPHRLCFTITAVVPKETFSFLLSHPPVPSSVGSRLWKSSPGTACLGIHHE